MTVVGAGPVGLMLAAELALAGADVHVLERRTEPDREAKAQSVNVATAEALDRRGLLPDAQESAPRVTGHFAGMVLDPDLVDWSDPDFVAHTAADRCRMLAQPRLEALLADHVARLGVPVHRGVEVTGLDDVGDGVRVRTSAGPMRTGWLVGCDGGHSAVRRLAGIEFPGNETEFIGYQAVVDLDDRAKLANGWVWSAHGVYRCGPQPGRVVTLEFGPVGARFARADRTTPVTLEEVQASLRRTSGTDVTVTGLRATPTRWTDNTRQAADYRSGRVLLAGDAAHVHPPFGGQGLNLGIGDAMNLGWKLGAVAAGRAPESLLDTYDTERRPVGAGVMDWTRAQTGLMRGDASSAALRGVLADLLGTPAGTTYAVKRIAGVTQRVDLAGGHPLAGAMVPDLWLRDGSRVVDHGHGGGFLLLDRVRDGTFARLAAPWATEVTIVADGDGTPTGVLVRPDGVIAWASDTDDAAGLDDALRRWAGGR
ncbi:FAD-dependent monooxygenase [Mycobacterium sp. NPDC006124]|uniref:FAD-dependent monooxygenase n=1 Tax=Mycobacterium sp. NPDC006124 TaxID=3156729 RepID=UPI0033B35622